MKINKMIALLALFLLSACDYTVSGCEGAFCVNASTGPHVLEYCDATGRCTTRCPDAQTVDESMLREITLARRLVKYCPAEHSVAFPNMTFDQTLDSAASSHAADMAKNNFVSNTGSDGLNVFDRVDALAGDGFSLDKQLAQLVVSGFSDAADVVDYWLDNPAHCAVLLSDKYSHLGASCAAAVGEQTRWSVVLGGSTR